MAIVYQKSKGLTDKELHYCPGCNHGIIHKLVAEVMEELGIIGPFEGSKPRQILITRDQWLEMQTTQGTAPTETLQIQTEFADEIDDM